MPWVKNFDVNDTLRKAGETFWSKGYGATSLVDLLEAMGIQKGSFYDTYGSKLEVYLRSLEQYGDERAETFGALIGGLSPKASLHALMKFIYEECIGPEGHRGCMVINCALELAHSDVSAQRVVQRGFEGHEEVYRKLIEAGQSAGEIRADLDAAVAAKTMLAIVMGMRVFSRAGAPKAALKTLAEQAMALIEG